MPAACIYAAVLQVGPNAEWLELYDHVTTNRSGHMTWMPTSRLLKPLKGARRQLAGRGYHQITGIKVIGQRTVPVISQAHHTHSDYNWFKLSTHCTQGVEQEKKWQITIPTQAMLVRQSPPLCYCTLTLGRASPLPEYTDQCWLNTAFPACTCNKSQSLDQLLYILTESRPVHAKLADFQTVCNQFYTSMQH